MFKINESLVFFLILLSWRDILSEASRIRFWGEKDKTKMNSHLDIPASTRLYVCLFIFIVTSSIFCWLEKIDIEARNWNWIFEVKRLARIKIIPKSNLIEKVFYFNFPCNCPAEKCVKEDHKEVIVYKKKFGKTNIMSR